MVSWAVVPEACGAFAGVVGLLLLTMHTTSAAGGLQATIGIVRQAASQLQAMTRRSTVSAQELATSLAALTEAVERAEDNRRYGRPMTWTGQESSMLAEYRHALDDYELSLLYLRSAEAYVKKGGDASSMASELARSARETAGQYWSRADGHLTAADKAFVQVPPQPEGARQETRSERPL
jgi:hypothetical protein